MSVLTRYFERKQLTQMIHGTAQPTFFGWGDGVLRRLLPATSIDYAAEVGNGLGSSVLAGPINWVMRAAPEAPPIVERFRTGQWEPRTDHALLRLMTQPNDFYDGDTLCMATIMDLLFGRAYWLKIRNRIGEPMELWWAPRQTMQAAWPKTNGTNGTTFISHYEYRPGGGRVLTIPVEDVVHFRFGLDPENPREGLSPLGSLMREVHVDDQAANFTGAILRNLGIIGVMLAPKEGIASGMDVQAIKEYAKEAWAGDRRGEPMAFNRPIDVRLLQWDMKGFDISPLRDVSEERVCAAIGIPAAVVGFGTGLHQTKVGATMREMRKAAWTDGIIPYQRLLAKTINRQLLTDFEQSPQANTIRFRYDWSEVPALWEEASEKHDRVRKDALAGLLRVDRAQALLGYEVDPDREVYLQPTSLAQIMDGEIETVQGGGSEDDDEEEEDVTTVEDNDDATPDTEDE